MDINQQKNFDIEDEVNRRQIHNDYINCVKEFPSNISLSGEQIIVRNRMILERSVEYCKTRILIDEY
jgi:hypothetical protein